MVLFFLFTFFFLTCISVSCVTDKKNNPAASGLSITQWNSWKERTNCVRWEDEQHTGSNRLHSSSYITLSGRLSVVSDFLSDLLTPVTDVVLNCASSPSVSFFLSCRASSSESTLMLQATSLGPILKLVSSFLDQRCFRLAQLGYVIHHVCPHEFLPFPLVFFLCCPFWLYWSLFMPAVEKAPWHSLLPTSNHKKKTIWHISSLVVLLVGVVAENTSLISESQSG